MPTIQWFPGHMAKAKREAQEKIKLVDLVIELADARIPESSRNPIIQEIIGQKPSLLILNKADLADPTVTRDWEAYYQRQGQQVVSLDAQHLRSTKAINRVIQDQMQDFFAKRKAKGIKPRAIRLMILGIPNVGKSTLINRFVGKNQTQTGNKPGVTKAQRWLKIGKEFELLDTPGILWPKFEDPMTGHHLALTGAIKDQLLPMQELALVLIEQLRQHYPGLLENHYQLEVPEDLSSSDYLIQFTQAMNLGEDFNQAGEGLIQDFRSGKLGALSLEFPQDEVD